MKWFHDKDGGLIEIPASADYYHIYAQCSICGMEWDGREGWVPATSDWIPFSGLSENLQAAALAEML